MENQQSQLHKIQQSLFTTSSAVRPMGLAGKPAVNVSQRQQFTAASMGPQSSRAASLGRVVMNANLPSGKNQTIQMSSQNANNTVKMTKVPAMPQQNDATIKQTSVAASTTAMNNLSNGLKAADKMQASAIHQPANVQKAVPANTVNQIEQMVNRFVKSPTKDARERIKKFHDKYEDGIFELHSAQLDNLTAKKLQTAPLITNYMDKSMHFSPEAITKSMDKFFTTLKGNEPLFIQFKEQLVAAAIGIATLASSVNPAFAEDGKPLPSGLVSYSQFLQGVQDHVIEKVRVSADGRTAEFINDEGVRGGVQLFNDPNLFKLLQENGVDLSVLPPDVAGNAIFGIIQALAFPLILFGGLFLLNRQNGADGGMGGPMNPMNMGKSKAKVQMEPDTGVTFDSVAGVDEAKEELTEIVDFLKQPERYSKLGAKIPRGALLIGPPGTGKTLLAKAVAGEAGVPFISISAAEFIEMFVGVGASRVRDLFAEAKKNAPCIVFIDELDAVGRQRAQGIGMGNDEREQTINQMLTEMDGFEGNTGVIVLAATNIPDVLDKALLRPGRFDRQIAVALPDFKGRAKILRVHSRDKALGDNVNLDEVAKRCLGMSGADLANVMNEAAIFASRKSKEVIEEEDIYDAMDRIQIGLEKKGATFSEDRQKLVSYHEAGHALLGALMKDYDLVNKISIVPRGGAGGVTIFTPNEEAMESGMYSKEYLENRICVAMGGRIAEEIINGKNKVTTGASNDFQQCTNTAKMMVEQMGMSDVIGPRNISAPQAQPFAQSGSPEGSELKNKADAEIDRILAEQYDRGMNLLLDNRSVLDLIAKTLIEKEKIDGVEMLNLIKDIKPELVTDAAMQAVKDFAIPVSDAVKEAAAEVSDTLSEGPSPATAQ